MSEISHNFLGHDQLGTKLEDSLASVQRIGEQRGQIPGAREELAKLVEAPLLPAAVFLYDQNIQTTESTANPRDAKHGSGGLVINFDTLSEQNQKIAVALATEDKDLPEADRRLTIGQNEADGHRVATIGVKLDEQTPVSEIITSTLAIAQMFKKQPMTWAPRATEAEVREWFAYPEDDTTSPESMAEETGYFLGRDGLFYRSEEHERKAHGETPLETEKPTSTN